MCDETNEIVTDAPSGGNREAGYRQGVRMRKRPAADLPGADLIAAGLDDLERGVESVEALLVSIGAPRLATLGFDVSRVLSDPEDKLYELLAREEPDAAHSRYNALIRQLVSFERGAECAS
jgi:hypothetical protein